MTTSTLAQRALVGALTLMFAVAVPVMAAESGKVDKAGSKTEKSEVKAEEPKSTGKRLEDDPYALDKLRKILEGGIPELMTVKVKVPSKEGEEAGGGASASTGKRASRKATQTAGASTAGNEAPVSLGIAPESHGAKGVAGGATAAHAGKASHEAHWDYAGDYAPHAWGKMKPEFSSCGNGKMQSPVHIQPGDSVPADLEPLGFEYGPLIGRIQHNGHTVQVDVQGNNMLVVRGKVYRLAQFHFHHPAEEMINYRGFPMVAHLVHKDSEGRLAVVALLMEVGAENPVLAQAWARMPMKAGEQYALDAGRVSVADALPKDRTYYAFQGSLTTPPCSEGVTWMVLKQPVQISMAQLDTFRRLFPLNARPVQPINGRLIQESR